MAIGSEVVGDGVTGAGLGFPATFAGSLLSEPPPPQPTKTEIKQADKTKFFIAKAPKGFPLSADRKRGCPVWVAFFCGGGCWVSVGVGGESRHEKSPPKWALACGLLQSVRQKEPLNCANTAASRSFAYAPEICSPNKLMPAVNAPYLALKSLR